MDDPGNVGRGGVATGGIATEKSSWLTPRELEAIPRGRVASTLWPIIWVTCLFMTFEIQLRSIGRDEPYPGTMLTHGLWLSDVGLLFPVLVVLVSGRLRSRVLKSGVLLAYIAAVCYGVAVGFVRGNWWSAITSDLRTSLGLVMGLCLVAMVPRRPRSLVAAIAVTSAGAILISSWALSASPRMAVVTSVGRLYDPIFFTINGLSLCLLAPSLTLSSAMGGRTLKVISWLSAGWALFVAVVLAQTRSLALAIALGLLFGVAGAVALSNSARSVGRTRGPWRKTMGMTVVVCVLVGVVGMRYGARVSEFQSRVQMKGGVMMDLNAFERVEEAIGAFRDMDLFDHLTGMGFGVKSPRYSWEGYDVFTLHVGVLNAWWRLGVLWFLGLMAGLLSLVWRYCQAFSRVRGRSAGPDQLRRASALVACAPGVWALAAIALISGGWAMSATISLGILWGIYRALVS